MKPMLTAAWLDGIGLPQAWAHQPALRLLDTDFADGDRFFQLWQAWADDPDACRMLHLVAISSEPPPVDTLMRTMAGFPALGAMAAELRRQWFGLLPGFHQLVLHGGRLRLTLCIGAIAANLRAQRFLADSIVVGAPPAGIESIRIGHPPVWNEWTVKSLGRLCRRASTIGVFEGSGLDPQAVIQAGFVTRTRPLTPASEPRLWCGEFQPRWQTARRRDGLHDPIVDASQCVVVGAGLAGAAVAHALALRGWRVTILESAAMPAAGASALPLGLLAPQMSRDDNPRSHLSRAGVRMTLQAAHRLLQQGQDWALSGTANYGADAIAALPAHWPQAGRAWADGTFHERNAQSENAWQAQHHGALWHAAAGWIKPARLVQAWLQHPGISLRSNCEVVAIAQREGQWQLRGLHGELFAQAPQLVIACAGNSGALLQMALAAAPDAEPAPLAQLMPVQGQVSWAKHGAQDATFFPPFPVNGAGSVAGHIPMETHSAWFAGASYENIPGRPLSEDQAHAHNLARLAQLLPQAAAALEPSFEAGSVRAWRGTRWTSADRLPLAGPWPCNRNNTTATAPGLWLSTAMGSRGLTYAALCGELIAAQRGGEPLPIEARLHRFIEARRALSTA